jgi:hypothetical protein
MCLPILDVFYLKRKMNNERKYYYKLDALPKKIMPNWVLVKLDILNKERRTKSGIWIASGKEDNGLDTDEVFRQIDRYGTVVMICDRLKFDPKIFHLWSLQWKTKIEIQVGDTVWSRAMGAHDCERFYIDKENNGEKYREYYKLIKYDELIVSKRGDKIIPLNGWILMEPYVNMLSKLLIAPSPYQNRNYGIIKYIGEPNTDYHGNYESTGETHKDQDYIEEIRDTKFWSDDRGLDVKVGQKIMHNFQEIWVESDYVSTFGEKLKICQRRHINAIVE